VDKLLITEMRPARAASKLAILYVLLRVEEKSTEK